MAASVARVSSWSRSATVDTPPPRAFKTVPGGVLAPEDRARSEIPPAGVGLGPPPLRPTHSSDADRRDLITVAVKLSRMAYEHAQKGDGDG
jgi:hypothetical protein